MTDQRLWASEAVEALRAAVVLLPSIEQHFDDNGLPERAEQAEIVRDLAVSALRNDPRLGLSDDELNLVNKGLEMVDALDKANRAYLLRDKWLDAQRAYDKAWRNFVEPARALLRPTPPTQETL